MSVTSPYIDMVGRPWADEQLDDILNDPDAFRTVEEAVRAGLSSDGSTCSFSAVKAWTFARYRRAEVAALFLVLVRHFLASEVAAAIGVRASK